MRNSWLATIVVLLLAIVPTMIFSDYHLFQVTMVVVYSVAILGMAILVGFNGQISLGHGAFYAIGAYTTAILMATWDVPYWLTLPISAVICAGFGFLIGLPALRLAGHYLALTTFALAVAVPQVLTHK
jgi:branched-chain amino acid transport system permease protein